MILNYFLKCENCLTYFTKILQGQCHEISDTFLFKKTPRGPHNNNNNNNKSFICLHTHV